MVLCTSRCSTVKKVKLHRSCIWKATVFAGELTIPALDFQDWVELHGMAMKSETNRVLLGRSFMAPYHVTYAGPEERFYFSRSPGPFTEAEYEPRSRVRDRQPRYLD